MVRALVSPCSGPWSQLGRASCRHRQNGPPRAFSWSSAALRSLAAPLLLTRASASHHSHRAMVPGAVGTSEEGDTHPTGTVFMVEFPVKDGEESLGVNWEMGKVFTSLGDGHTF